MESSSLLRARIALGQIRQLHADTARQLLARIGTEERFFTASQQQLHSIANLPHRITDTQYRQTLLDNAAAEERFIKSNDIAPLYFNDEDYPTRLTQCNDAPVMLYKLGKADMDCRHCVAIVGTRHATPYGLNATARIVQELSQKLDGLLIISGLAYGIDVAAHKAALDAGVPTVAVCAHPLNTIYPADHRGVAVSMLERGGALVSEYPTCSIVHRANFLERNRIVAGLCDALIIVESDLKGGAMVTAKLAAEYDREVFALPGRMTDTYSRGCNALIAASRAHIFTDTDSMIETMNWSSRPAQGTQMELPLELSPAEQSVIDFLVANPGATINELIISTGLPMGQLKDVLFGLEMDDRIMSIAGGKYTAIPT